MTYRVLQALLQFEDDRQDKLIHDQREKRRVNDIAKTAAEAPAPAPAHEGTSETDQGAQRPPTYQQGQRLGTRDNFVNNAMPEVDSERDDN